MSQSLENRVKLVEVRKDDASLPRLRYRYLTKNYYDLSIIRKPESWTMTLILKPLDMTLEKNDESDFFREFVEEPRVFAAELDGEQIGWIELGYQKWNNRLRVWEFLVKEEFRRRGVGTILMKHAFKTAREKGARMVVLETQSCNVPAIGFYLKQGFELIGFDAAAYSNEDIQKKEVRLEFGLKT